MRSHRWSIHRRPPLPRRSPWSARRCRTRAAPLSCRADCAAAHQMSIPPNRAHPTTPATSASSGNRAATSPRPVPYAVPDPRHAAAPRSVCSARAPAPVAVRPPATAPAHRPGRAPAVRPDPAVRAPSSRVRPVARAPSTVRAPSTAPPDRYADALAPAASSAPPRIRHTTACPAPRIRRRRRAAANPTVSASSESAPAHRQRRIRYRRLPAAPIGLAPGTIPLRPKDLCSGRGAGCRARRCGRYPGRTGTAVAPSPGTSRQYGSPPSGLPVNSSTARESATY